jgi:hypothetical protein
MPPRLCAKARDDRARLRGRRQADHPRRWRVPPSAIDSIGRRAQSGQSEGSGPVDPTTSNTKV